LGGFSPRISKTKREGIDSTRVPYFERDLVQVTVRSRCARVIATYISRRSSSSVSSASERACGRMPSSAPAM
jgi:hypothetical protein